MMIDKFEPKIKKPRKPALYKVKKEKALVSSK